MFFKVLASMILKSDFQLTSEFSFGKAVIPPSLPHNVPLAPCKIGILQVFEIPVLRPLLIDNRPSFYKN